MTAPISLIPEKTGAHRAPLQLPIRITRTRFREEEDASEASEGVAHTPSPPARVRCIFWDIPGMLARTTNEILEYTVERSLTEKIPGRPTCFFSEKLLTMP